MDGQSISQVSDQTGFSPSALRFYESSGLVQPGRTDAGYRSYDDRQVEQLAFVRRAKGLGLSLEEIAELLELLDGKSCAPVQARLRQLVDRNIAEAQNKISELLQFVDDLSRSATSLQEHTPEGPCDETCGCTTATPEIPSRMGQLERWRYLVKIALIREHIEGGACLLFERTTDLAAIAKLIDGESECCATSSVGPGDRC